MSRINFGKHLPRRTFLRGLGATVALPLLDGMVPAFAGQGSTAATAVRRLAVVYVPNGMNMANWKPKTEGTNFQLPPILQPLGKYKDKVLVLSGMSNLHHVKFIHCTRLDSLRCCSSTALCGVHELFV